MTFQGAVGADPDALGRLALALERMGDEIDQRRAVARVALTRSGASAPSVDQLGEVVAWVREMSTDVRRRAVLAASAGRPWRHPSWSDHARGVGRAWVRGVGDGLIGVVQGGEAVADRVEDTVTQPGRVLVVTAEHGPRGVWDVQAHDQRETVALLGAMARGLSALDPGMTAMRMPARVARVGVWAAAEHTAHDSGTQVPGAVATLAGLGAGSVVGAAAAAGAGAGAEVGLEAGAGAGSRIGWRATAAGSRGASDVSNLSFFAPGSPDVSRATITRVLPLSVPVSAPAAGARGAGTTGAGARVRR